MADDSLYIQEESEFHSCSVPHGTKNYVLGDLTPDQKVHLNDLRRNKIREDQKYLSEHPEIRGIIMMILRILMRNRPMHDLHEVIGRYFLRPSVDLEEEISQYLEKRNQILSSPSFISVKKSEIEIAEEIKPVEVPFEPVLFPDEEILLTTNFGDLDEWDKNYVMEESFSDSEEICTEIVNEILETILEVIEDDEEDEESDELCLSPQIPEEYTDLELEEEEDED